MKLLRMSGIFIVMGIVGVTLSHAASIQPPAKPPRTVVVPKYQNTVLFVFLDDTEIDLEHFGALTIDFSRALLQEAGPILVSSSLIKTIYQEEAGEGKTAQERLKHFYELQEKDALSGAENGPLRKAEAIKLLEFNAKKAQARWIIKKINAGMCLMIPKKYLKNQGIDFHKVSEVLDDLDQITDVEFKLGLKVNHFETINARDVKRPTEEEYEALERQGGYFNQGFYSQPALPGATGLFVYTSEYPKRTSYPISQWALAFFGHGTLGKTIISLPFNDFKELLENIASDLYVRLFYYNSCYAAGVTNELLYGDSEAEMGQKTYPFMIIAHALTESTTSSHDYIVEFMGDGEGYRIDDTANYVAFAQLATVDDVLDYRALAAAITPEVASLGVDSLGQVRLPGTEWFSMNDADRVISLGKVVAKTRTQPLNVKEYIHSRQSLQKAVKKADADCLAVLLYTSEIPFEVVITTKTMPKIASMIPGAAVHRFRKIRSHFDLQKTLDAFCSLQDLVSEKIFFINELEYKKKDGNSVSVKDVLIRHTKDEGDTVFYMQGERVRHLKKMERLEDKKTLSPKDTTETDEMVYPYLLQNYVFGAWALFMPEEGQELIEKLLKEPIASSELANTLRTLFYAIPDGYCIKIPKIRVSNEGGFEVSDWQPYFKDLSQLPKTGSNKLLWVGEVELPQKKSKKQDYVSKITNIFIDSYDETRRVFYTTSSDSGDLSVVAVDGILRTADTAFPGYLERYEEIYRVSGAEGKLMRSSEDGVDKKSVFDSFNPTVLKELEGILLKQKEDREKIESLSPEQLAALSLEVPAKKEAPKKPIKRRDALKKEGK